MQDYIVLALVVVISVAAHVWLFLWIKFRIDEAVVVRCLQDAADSVGLTVESVAERVGYKVHRVAAVFSKSEKIECVNTRAQLWSVGR